MHVIFNEIKLNIYMDVYTHAFITQTVKKNYLNKTCFTL